MRPVLVVLLLAACSPYRNVCTDLREQLEGCGFPVGELDCSRIVYSDVENLTQRLEERGCDGAQNGEDEAVDQRLCVLNDWKCPGTPVPNFTAAQPLNPIVLVSGIDSTATFDWNPRIKAPGMFHIKVRSWATTRERSEDLWLSIQALRSRLGGKKLNLICYAVGGLDCRFIASPNGLLKGADHAAVVEAIASITTIATPHRGTRVAEAAISALQSGTASELLQAFVGNSVTTQVPDDAELLRTLDGLTLEAVEAFNRDVSDEPQIVYQSWAGVSHVQARTSTKSEELIRAHCTAADGSIRFMRHADTRDAMNELLWMTSPFAGATHGDNGKVVTSPSDGMVSVASARWGEFQGCLPADHYDVIGQIAHTTRDPLTGFDAPRFYQYVASGLAERGL